MLLLQEIARCGPAVSPVINTDKTMSFSSTSTKNFTLPYTMHGPGSQAETATVRVCIAQASLQSEQME